MSTLITKLKSFRINMAELKPVLKNSISLIIVSLATFVLENLSMIPIGGMGPIVIPVATIVLETLIMSHKRDSIKKLKETEPVLPPDGVDTHE